MVIIEKIVTSTVVEMLASILLLLCIVCVYFMIRKVRTKKLADLLGIVGIDEEINCLVKKNGYIKYYEIKGIDILHMSKQEQEIYFSKLNRFNKTKTNYGILTLNMPCAFNEHLYDDFDLQNKNEVLKKASYYKMEKIKKMNKDTLNRRKYIILETKSREEMEEDIYNVEYILSMCCPLIEMSIDETIQIMKLSTNQYKLVKENNNDNS